MPSTPQTFNARPDPSQRSNASISIRSGNDERPRKSKKSKSQSEATRGTDSSKIPPNPSSRSSPPLPDHEEPETRPIYEEPKPKTKSIRHSHSVEVPETPQKGVKDREDETEKSEEMEEADAGTGAKRQASMSLGYSPSPKVRHPHRQGVSRIHLTRDVKVLPTLEKFSPLPRSSPTQSISQTSSEYIPTPGPSQSSCSSRSSPGNAVQPSIQDTAEVPPNDSRPGTTQGDVLFPDLVIPNYFFRLRWYDDRVQQFIRVLNERFRHIELTTVKPLTVEVHTRDVVEVQRLRDQIHASFRQVSYILDRYNTLIRAGLIRKHNSFLRRARAIWHDCVSWLAETDQASFGPSAFLAGGDDASNTQRHQWKVKAKASGNESQAPEKNNYVKPSTAFRADGTAASNLGNQEKVPHKPSYFPVRKSLPQKNSLAGSQQGIEVQIPRRNPSDESSNNRWIQTQAEWDRRNRREVTAARIGGSYHTKPPPTPATESIASDRLMSSIPPEEFYRSPLDVAPRALDKPKYSSPTSRESHSSATEGKVKNSDGTSGNMADPKESLASSSSLSHPSSQSRLSPSVASTEHCNETNESKSGKHTRRTSVVSQESSGHGKNRTRSASRGHKGCCISTGDESSASRVTTLPLNRSSREKKSTRKHQRSVPSNVLCGSENDESFKTSISSGRTQPSGFDSNPSNVGQFSAPEKPDINSRCRVDSELQSPESAIASKDFSVDMISETSDLPNKRSRDKTSVIPSSPEKRTRKTDCSHTNSSRRHDIDVSSYSTSSSEESANQTPASDARSRKRKRGRRSPRSRKDEPLATPSSLEKRRRNTSHIHPDHDADGHISADEDHSSVTTAPGPSKQSKGKGRALLHDAGEAEGSHPGGADDRGQEALQHTSPNIQRSGGQTLPAAPGYRISRLIGRDTPWLEDTVERKVKEILEKQRMPPPPPNPLRPRPHSYDPGDVSEGQRLSDEQIVAIVKNKSLSNVVRFARAPEVFAQTGLIRAKYYYLEDMLDEEDWQRIGPRRKIRAPPPQLGT